MKNNRLRLIKSSGQDKTTVKSRNRLIRLYNALREKGGWRAVQKERGASNVAVAYNFALHGIEPKRIEDREACFLPVNKCLSCHRPIKSNKPHEHKAIPSWMKAWKQLPKEKRDNVIRSFIEKVTG